MKLYTVTTIAPSGSAYGGTRLVAICSEERTAEQLILQNAVDMYETTYTFAIIEAVESDVMYGASDLATARWFQWVGSYNDGNYVACAPPEDFLCTIGFYEAGPIRNALIELRTDRR